MGSARHIGSGGDSPWPFLLSRGAAGCRYVVKRAQGGSDFDLDRLVVALCPPCHAQTDAPYGRGQLVITARGQGRFTCEVMQGADKWVARGITRLFIGAGPQARRTLLPL